MINHRTAETLMATAIDFALTADELASLNGHLAGCDRCRIVATQLRREVSAMEDLEAEDAPLGIRAAVEAAALQGNSPNPRLMLLLAAALLMAMMVGGAIVLNGDFFDTDGLTVNPSPSAAPSSGPGIALPTATLAYVQRSGSTSFIHTVEPDGSNDRTLNEGWSPVWSPDGSSIAYGCPAGDTVSDICIGDADGVAEAVLVSQNIGGFSGPLQWSPSGGQLLFMHSGGDSPLTWIANADGTGIRQIGDGLGSWSPDGTWIMLVRVPMAPPDTSVVSVMRPDGSQLRDLGEGYSATWSPDSSQIAFMVNGELRAYDVADGGASMLNERIPGGTLTWVSDNRIVIGSEAGLYAVDLAAGVVELAVGLPIRSTPVLSPDGKWLAFAAAEGDSTDVYLAPLAGGGVVQVTTDGVSDSPAWQPLPTEVEPSPSPSGPDLGYAAVTADQLRVRTEPRTDAPQVGTLERNSVVSLLEGPTTADGFAWYRVRYGDLTGWSAAGDGSEDWLGDVPPGTTDWVLRVQRQYPTGALNDMTVVLYPDGRLVAPGASGWELRRLTGEGTQLFVQEAVSSALLQADAAYETEPPGYCCGYTAWIISVVGEQGPVTVSALSSSDAPEAALVVALAERLTALAVDPPTAWQVDAERAPETPEALTYNLVVTPFGALSDFAPEDFLGDADVDTVLLPLPTSVLEIGDPDLFGTPGARCASLSPDEAAALREAFYGLGLARGEDDLLYVAVRLRWAAQDSTVLLELLAGDPGVDPCPIRGTG